MNLTYRTAAAVLIIVGSRAIPANAQNGSSFADAGQPAVQYTALTARAQADCSSLVSLTGYDYSIISATLVATAEGVPEYCRVSGVIPPEILFEVNLPTAWNRRLYMHGNGGYAGTPPDAPARIRVKNRALAHGFATTYTNTGHDRETEPLGTFAYNNVQKEIDYSFRAVHLTVVSAKEIVRAYYDRAPAYSYWDGCSTGGRQGLMSAQRFPADFDGIIVGAPVLNFTDTQIWGAWTAKALLEAPISLAKMEIVAREVYSRCDALDGLEDGLIDDPRRCEFDPAEHLPKCDGDPAGDCFTAGEIRTLRKIYGGVISNGKVLFPGQPVGAEAAVARRPGSRPASSWNGWIINEKGPSRLLVFAETFLKYMAFQKDDHDYDWKSFDYDKDPARMEFTRRILDARNPDLSAFAERGGKIIMYFGWADTALNPLMGVDYYEQVTATMGAGTKDFFRLFMAPGMFHCSGGFGPSRCDAMTPLAEWVENGVAPDSIIASKVDGDAVKMTRPLCPYPQVARYKGSGSTDEAGNFACVDPQ